MARNFIQPGRVMDYHNTGSTVIMSGAVVPFASRIAVAQVTIPAGEIGAVQVDGVWSLPKKAGLELAQGADVFWADAAIAAAGDLPAGMVFEPAAATDAVVHVKIG